MRHMQIHRILYKITKYAHGGDNEWAWVWKTFAKLIISVFGEYFSAEFFDYEILKKKFFLINQVKIQRGDPLVIEFLVFWA